MASDGKVEALYYELGLRAEAMEAGKAKAEAVFKDIDLIAAKTGKTVDEVAAAANRAGVGAKGISTVASGLKEVAEKGEHAGTSLHGFLRPLESLATEAIGANAQVGNLASKLSVLGLSSEITLGLLAGIYAIVKAWDFFTDGARKAKKAVDDLLDSLQKGGAARQQASTAFAQTAVNVALADEMEKLKALQEAQRGRLTTVRPGIQERVSDPKLVQQAQDDLNKAMDRTAEAEAVLAERRKADTDAAVAGTEREVAALGKVLLARKASSAEVARAAELIKRFQSEADAITGSDAASTQRKAELLGLIDQLTAASKKEGESAKQLLDQQSQVRQAFQAAIAAQTPDKADDFEASVDRLVKAAQKAHLGATEIQSMVTELRGAHTKALNQEAVDFSNEMQAELVKSTGLQADALRAALVEFDTKVKDAVNRGVLVDPQLASKLREAKVEAIALAEATDRLSADLVQIDHNSAQGFGFLDSMKTVLADLDQANADFDSAKARGDVAGMAAAQQRINTLLGAEKKLQDDIAAIIAKQATETASLTERIASGIAAVANTAFGLASAFAGANSELAKMLGGIGQAASGVEALMKQANTKDANGVAPGFGGILSTGAGLLQAAPAIGQIIGGAIGLASALFGKSPEEQARLQALKENNERLRELSEHVGDLAKINVQGTDLAKFTALLSDPRFNTVRGESGSDIQNRDIGAILTSFGITTAQLQQFAQQFGIKIGTGSGGKITIDDINALIAALQNSELNQFAEDFTGQMQRMDAEIKVFSLEKPIQQFEEFRKVLGSIQGGTGALGNLLQGLDLTTAAGLDAARQTVEALFTQFQSLSGDQLAAFLGGLSPEDFVNAIERLTEIINAQAGSGAVAGTGGFNVDRSITEVTGSRLAALLSTDVIWNQQTAENTAKLVDLFAGRAPTLISAPTLAATQGPVGGTTIVFEGGITVSLGGGIPDRRQAAVIGEQISDSMIDEINRKLGARLRLTRRANGLVN